MKVHFLINVSKLAAGLTWKNGVEYTEDHGPQVKLLQADATELRDAEPHKNVIGIKQTT